VIDEESLIDSALAGNSQAFGQLVAYYQDRLFSAMVGVCGNIEQAEDVVQEAFVQAYVKLNTFQRQSRFFTWLYRIALNGALSRRRRNRGETSIEQNRELTGAEPLDDGEAPDDPILRDEKITMVRQAMDRLSDDHRSILVLREMQGFSYEHIAESLEISIGTVRSRLSRARTALREDLEKSPGWE
jgi:RNA polymerase sigma-70 factor (ECF subfamily)